MTILEHLLNLFRVDAQLRGLRSRVGGAENYLATQQTKLTAAIDQKTEIESRTRQVKAKVANVEVEVASLNARIEKLRAELNTSATQKQYAALLSEINTVKAQKTELENSILQDMEAMEALAKQLPIAVAQVEERTKLRDMAQAQLEERRNDVSERLSELEVERAAAAGLVSSDALRVFEQMSDTYDGEAMATLEIIDQRNREYACGACNMQVPFESFSLLRGRGDALVRCSTCKRILYIDAEAPKTLAKK